MSGERSIELEVDVVGSTDDVWRAVATGPGISSWYVPQTVEERLGGATTTSFGPEMTISGKVLAWDPPHRVVFGGDDGLEAMTFEWLVDDRGDGTCVVRLVNGGFGSGAEWDAQYNGMTNGWPLFLLNLSLHLEHFGGRTATPMIPGAHWLKPAGEAWTDLTSALGIPATPTVGERVAASGPTTPPLVGTVVGVGASRVALLLDEPCPGTAFIAVEGQGDEVEVSVWSYLYGPQSSAIADRDGPRWSEFLTP